MKEFSLRIAERKDVQALVNALSASSKGDDSLEAMNRLRNRVLNEINGLIPNSKTYIIEYLGESVGRLRLVEEENELFLGGIQLLPEYQGIGLGSLILRHLINHSKSENKCLRLEVERNNPRAKKLYLSLGFVVEQSFEDKEFMVRAMSTPV
ncbi:GNAT family N-acetyltransferase [Vibrio sp. 10N.222.51.E8]|uniref:GNAT family N-acetyltransferase n=1 Tax=Vibrio sp. 10N.222.51.E8 TaxID=3229625 RepID=UPI00354DDE87